MSVSESEDRLVRDHCPFCCPGRRDASASPADQSGYFMLTLAIPSDRCAFLLLLEFVSVQLSGCDEFLKVQ